MPWVSIPPAFFLRYPFCPVLILWLAVLLGKLVQRDVANEGGLSGMRTSGYGERLAQDTKQQVSYASNLTR